ncbi:bifunctional 4-hydroxy-2-oxoglutarate aldolase/2-dehydro-3-deoxy-phosphogluconate aldolase [Halapricum hydrolyticum]|uniref:Bifunctional 4-hydroxy-2-oxoglutarate aldolase/2-dehydro-3-deoxy-phosphogluconate aldolase n=1 Tax=Halapricum hydrolyticum TaxID=2979991 RepID=A0AAE3IC44_9EURY|nr:bifunctional 4-hydroxy-2-oxoglutarate aldolase/2-dehydro-3-deoxy-phosphogluconate aldolase [Halapricum hydrolyticum]MCU4718627.1 bifunctional 4-hydroxy-2-oxoglutarate aldolase/2-dehydro-3-deoxy-phosphogluconate aldolase [Halapricum hydrolyticum]MCU4727686.1 bifunctional 4-hydroxy-2-oxoglutarate aldolase/2-dehydro-3-deoxy-phosphogluconate aldolase [Halapricum hydrolyticum]
MTDALERLLDSGVVAVLRDIDPEALPKVADALAAAGVTALEVTTDGHDASRTIARLAESTGDEVLVGAGTVMDAATASRAIEAGAEFVVSPHLDREVVATANRRSVVVGPGVMTPTEAADAMAAGADLLKVFPASTVGPDHLSAIRGPLGDVPIMPTGGIGPDNVEAFFDAGAAVVGAGSALLDYDAIAHGDYDAVQSRAESFLDAVDDAR